MSVNASRVPVSLDRHLHAAWRLVSRGGGAAGIDGVSVEKFKDRLERNLATIAKQLLADRYQFSRLLPVRRPKEDGSFRTLEIPTVADRVVLQCLRLELEPKIEPKLMRSSHAYRSGRSAHTAMRTVTESLARGNHWLVKTDIESFFDSIPHRELADCLGQFGVAPLPKLLSDSFRMTSGWRKRRCGIVQGSPLSPLLANSFLNEFDRELIGRCTLVRYSDDFVMMGKSRKAVENALQLAKKSLSSLKLRLHGKKTVLLDNRESAVDFLGFRLSPDRITPTEANIQNLKEAIAESLNSAASLSAPMRLQRLNGVLRSFAWYYQHTDCGRLLLSLDALVDERHEVLRQSDRSGEAPNRRDVVRLSQLRQTSWKSDPSDGRGAARWNGYG